MLVNALLGQRLARTSGTPGRTRLLNLFRVQRDGQPPFYLVDLPGYGYAPGGAATAASFEALTRDYFESRAGAAPVAGRAPAAFGVLLLVDARHPGLDNDRRAHEWLVGLGLTPGVVATKADKLSRGERSRAQSAFERAFSSPVLPVSAATGEGIKDLWKLIARLLSSSLPPSPRKKSSISPP